MKKHKFILKAIFVGGAVAIMAGPVWSQEAPGEHRQPDRNLTRPGENENIPGMHGKGTVELSKADMQRVEEALKTKGYDPGKIDGVVDDANRAAIRSFQKNKGIPITGTVDQRTAEQLGVNIGSKAMSSDRSSTQNPPKSEGRSQDRDSDENVPRDTRSK